jgi:phosphatidylserine/phosphatidylglycerophosphate/cardiolipin synthase-like enzyme
MWTIVRRYWPVSAVLLMVVLVPLAPSKEVQTTDKGTVDVLFSPKGGCEARIVKEIGEARKSIRIQAYYFTNATIAKAVLDAKKRGVGCEAVLDKVNWTDRYSAATFFKNQGISVRIDSKHSIAHNKIIIIDDSTVITGSYNFTQAAEENNAENLLILKGIPGVAEQYLANYQEHKAHSEEYTGPARDQSAPGAAPVSPRPPVAENRAANTDQNQDDQTVYVTRTGTKYHRAGCSDLRSSSIPMKLKDAKARYSPCSRCNPRQ